MKKMLIVSFLMLAMVLIAIPAFAWNLGGNFNGTGAAGGAMITGTICGTGSISGTVSGMGFYGYNLDLAKDGTIKGDVNVAGGSVIFDPTLYVTKGSITIDGYGLGQIGSGSLYLYGTDFKCSFCDGFPR